MMNILLIKKILVTAIIFVVPLVLVLQSILQPLLVWVGACFALALLQKTKIQVFASLAYLAFFSTSLLSAAGFMSVLTGLDDGIINSSGALWGFSFFSLSLSYYIYTEKGFNFSKFLWLIQPIRFFTGPIINSSNLGNLNISKRKVLANFTWIILGTFYLYVVAPSLKPFLSLKTSINFVDILIFSTAFEMYVYFNFAGASFLVMGALKCLGINCVNNFNAPFSGRNVIDYWQRWHRSLSHLCKILFYIPIKDCFGIYGIYFAVVATFLSSAMWHGITINFLIWGGFHSLMWLLTYQLLRVKKKTISYLIFFPTIILGRLFFSESDTAFLMTKIGSLVTGNIATSYDFLSLSLGKAEILMLIVALGIIIGEIVLPKKFNNYKIFRKGWGIIFLLILILLFAIDDTAIVYGAR